MILFSKGTELTIFGQLNIPMKFSINLSINKASKLSTYDFLHGIRTTLPHHLIKDKLIDLINRTFIWENRNIWLAKKNALFSPLVYTIITIDGLVKKL